jgi:hypothetical protein
LAYRAKWGAIVAEIRGTMAAIPFPEEPPGGDIAWVVHPV